jgi:transcriptional regulator with XRE-family HTH domain
MPKKKNLGGRKAFEPTMANRLLVRKLARAGWSQDDIAEGMGVSDETLRKYFRYELDMGNLEMCSTIESTLYEIATDKEHKSCVPAATVLLKAKGGEEYRETKRTEITGADGGPLQQQIQSVDVIDASKLSFEERDTLTKILESATDISEEQREEFESEDEVEGDAEE